MYIKSVWMLLKTSNYVKEKLLCPSLLDRLLICSGQPILIHSYLGEEDPIVIYKFDEDPIDEDPINIESAGSFIILYSKSM